MSSRRFKRRMLVVGVVAAAVLVTPMAAHAGGVAEGDCRLSDTQFLPGEPGWSQSLSQVCGGNSAWQAEASYYWTDEKLVIIEPREGAFDYSAFSQLNPFTGDGYSFRKANELFPDTSSATAAYEKLTYTTAALGAKPRAIQSRNGDLAADTCSAVPRRWPDAEIAAPGSLAFLPPVPRPDGKTGTYTYSLSTTLTAGQRSTVLAALVAFAKAIDGSKQPQLIPWVSGDANPPVITFENAPGGFDETEVVARVQRITSDTGRDHLQRWVNGNVALTDAPEAISPWTVMHELLHIYGFGHIGPIDLGQVMSAALYSPSMVGEWDVNVGPLQPIFGAIDACTKAGINAAPAP